MKVRASASFTCDDDTPPVSSDNDEEFDSDGIGAADKKVTKKGSKTSRRKVSKQSSKSTNKKDDDDEADKNVEVRKRRLGKNDKLRLKKKEMRDTERKELLLNAREIIPFGERVDAPPKFTGSFGREVNASSSQAGKKDLLLKSLLGLKPDEKKPAEPKDDAPAIKKTRLIGLSTQPKTK